MTETVKLPITKYQNEKWVHLSKIAPAGSHWFVGEKFSMEENYSFHGQHRVRLIKLKNNVWWKIPVGVEVDISAVVPANPPPVQQVTRRHGRR